MKNTQSSSRQLIATFAWLGILSLVACGEVGDLADTGLGDDSDTEPALDQVEQNSYPRTSSAWSMVNGVATIPVCWQAAGNVVEKGWVRAMVESTYEAQPYFHVNFTGWGVCAAASSGVRIQVADEMPQVRKLGNGLNGLQNGMRLNFTFNNVVPICAGSDAVRRMCIERSAFHEFGHALGLAHEQNRPDRPAQCPDAPQGTMGDLYVGEFDQGSMMSYCNPVWNNGGVPSGGDVAGLARLYGGGGDVFAATSLGNSFDSALSRHDWLCINDEICLPGDFNGDGRTDLAAFTRGNTADVYVSLSDGAVFTGTAVLWNPNFAPGTSEPAVGDFNGDSLDDIAYFTKGNAGDVFVSLNTGGGFAAAVKWHDFFAGNTDVVAVGDFNGDGRDDLASFTRGNTGDVYVALSTGRVFGWPERWHDWFAINAEVPAVGDFNGDGMDDIVTFLRGASGDAYVALSNGAGFGAGVKWHDWFAINAETPAIGDVNGDGRDDVLSFAKGTTGLVYVSLSTGAAFNGTNSVWTSGLCLLNDVCLTGDITGDGRTEAIGIRR